MTTAGKGVTLEWRVAAMAGKEVTATWGATAGEPGSSGGMRESLGERERKKKMGFWRSWEREEEMYRLRKWKRREELGRIFWDYLCAH